MHAAVFLDRDGTLCHDMADPADSASVTLIRGAAAAVSSLRGLGYKIVVVTNQGVVARGRCTEEQVVAAHDRINELIRQTSGVSVDRFYYCPYSPEGTIEKYCRDHPWRKPQPGMLKQAATEMGLDLSRSWMIGDRAADIAAGAAVGARTILLDEKATVVRVADETYRADGVKPDFVAPNLIEAVKAVAQQRRPETTEQAQGLLAMARSALETLPPVQPTPPSTEPVASPAPEADEMLRVQRQILQELRGQRPHAKSHSPAYAAAICLQIVAGVCFLGALFMGRAAGAEAFVKWIGCALFLQLATLTALLFDRR